VVVDQGALKLSGVNVANYAFLPDLPNSSPNDGFAYDPATFTATWTLTAPIDSDKLVLRLNADGASPIVDGAGNRLDGEWTNPTSTTQLRSSVFPSGNGTGGGDFLFRFNVLPGDVDQSGKVILADYCAVLRRNTAQRGDANYSVFCDVTGSCKITLADYSAVLSRKNQTLPTAEPMLPSLLAAKTASAKTQVSQTSQPSSSQLIDLYFQTYDELNLKKDIESLLLAPVASVWGRI